MKKLLILTILTLTLTGCITTKPSNNYQLADLSAIIIPKNVEKRDITVSRVNYNTNGEQSIETKVYTVHNLFYPNDSTYLCSGTKAKSDLNAAIDDLSSTIKQ